DAAAIRATFAGLWSINGGDAVTEKLIKNAIAHPSRFVLKPQLEGGGGNFYGEKMAEKLKSMEKEELGAFILMERIQPLVVENYLLRAMQPPQLANVVSELGVYGYALGDRGMAEVRQGGHLLRTKSEEVDEVIAKECATNPLTTYFIARLGRLVIAPEFREELPLEQLSLTVLFFMNYFERSHQ
ncbi:unnamed protein product, partial [Cylicostephanus goldi]